MNKPLKREFANRRSNPFTTTRNMGTLVLPPRTPVRSGSSPSGMDVLLGLLNDDKVIECMGALMHEITGRTLLVKPGGNTELDAEASDFVKQQLSDIGQDQGLDEMLNSMATCLVTGQSFSEIMWNESNGKVVVQEVRPKDPRRLEWHETNGQLRPALYTLESGTKYLPPRKFLITRYWSIPTESPYGYGVGEVIYNAVLYRAKSLSNMDISADKYSTPVVLGTYPASATVNQVQEFLQLVNSMRSNTSAIKPEGFALEFLQPPTAGEGLLNNLYEKSGEIISLLMLGEASVGKQYGSGSYARDQVSQSIRERKAHALSKVLCNTLKQTLVTWMVELNYPNAAIPSLEFDFSGYFDLDMLLKLQQLGFSTTADYVGKLVGFPVQNISRPGTESESGLVENQP